MENKIQDILQELYAIDPKFKDHEKELVTLVSKIVALKPDTKFDAAFAQRLRLDLISEAAVTVPEKKITLNYILKNMTKIQYAFGGGVIALLLLVPVVYYNMNQATPSSISSVAGFSLESKVTTLKQNAFGSLEGVESVSGKGGAEMASSFMSDSSAGRSVSAPMPASVGMGGGVAVTEDTGSSVGKMMVDPQIYPVDYVQYTYAYKGEPLKLEKDGLVYKRVKGIGSSRDLAALLQNMNFSLVDLDSFGAMNIRNVELFENKSFGYSVNIDFAEGALWINPNWEKWNFDKREYAPINPSDIPDDKILIAMSDKFLKEHGIASSKFGKPVVQKPFMPIAYATDAMGAAESLTSPIWYGPETINVIYPLSIAGLEVYDEGGYPYGLQVMVSIRDKRVQSVGELKSQEYQSSKYTLENDEQAILKTLTSDYYGGYYPLMEGGGEPVSKEIQLGTPKKVLMRYFQYSDGVSNELLVPALLFPITSNPDPNQSWMQSRVIPLPKEILKDRLNPPVMIMEKAVPPTTVR